MTAPLFQLDAVIAGRGGNYGGIGFAVSGRCDSAVSADNGVEAGRREVSSEKLAFC